MRKFRMPPRRTHTKILKVLAEAETGIQALYNSTIPERPLTVQEQMELRTCLAEVKAICHIDQDMERLIQERRDRLKFWKK